MRGLSDPYSLLAAKAACATLGTICAPPVLFAFAINADAHTPVPRPFDIMLLLLGLAFAAGTAAVMRAGRDRPAWNRRVAAPVASVVGVLSIAAGVTLSVFAPEAYFFWVWPVIYGAVHLRAATTVWRLP